MHSMPAASCCTRQQTLLQQTEKAEHVVCVITDDVAHTLARHHSTCITLGLRGCVEVASSPLEKRVTTVTVHALSNIGACVCAMGAYLCFLVLNFALLDWDHSCTATHLLFLHAIRTPHITLPTWEITHCCRCE